MSDRAFSPLADGQAFFWSKTHSRARAALEYGLMSGAVFTTLTGAPGTGKTSLLLHLMQTAEPDLRFAMVRMPHAGITSLSGWILQALGQDAGTDRPEIARYGVLHQTLIETYAQGGRTVLVFDDAQDLTDAALQELLRLSDMNTAQDQILQIVLSGQVALSRHLNTETHAALGQRVAARAHLEALFGDEVRGYISKRLSDVSGPADLFEAPAIASIEKLTYGLPRLINQLCELALIYLMTTDRPRVTEALIQQIVTDERFLPPTGQRKTQLRVPAPRGMA